MTELEPIEKHRLANPPDEVDAALLQLALNGGQIARTVRELKSAGISVSADQLSGWRDKFPLRYAWHHNENARKLEDEIVQRQREVITAALDAARAAVDLELENIQDGKVRDASASARNLATVAGIGTTKVLELTGRPTSVVEHRKPEEIRKRLKELGFIEGTAEEVDG